jgi:hypothetical protein
MPGDEGCVCRGAGAMLVVDTAARTLARTEWHLVGEAQWWRRVVPPRHAVPQADETTAREYVFAVPEECRHFLTVLTPASMEAEFNDVWLSVPFGSGTRLYDPMTAETADAGTTYVKEHQNGRADYVGVFSTDHEPATFSTGGTLVPGDGYHVNMAARSPKFVIKRLYRSSCTDDQCAPTGAKGANAANSNANFTPCT